MLRSLVLALAVAGAFSISLAHRAPLPTSNATLVRDTVSSTIAGFTLDEVIAWSDAQYTRTISWGRYVRYGGTLILAGSLIYAGLDWFYNYAKRVTGTPLDDWWNMSSGPYSDWRWIITGGSCDSYWNSYEWGYVCPNCQYRHITAGHCPPEPSVSLAEDAIINREGPIDGYEWVDPETTGEPVYVIPPGGGDPFAVDAAYVRINRPPLPDYLRAYPDAADGVIEVATSYIDEYPDFPLTFDSPIPGLSLDPAPNGNQWFDNPFFDPLLDTDNDGWPDWFEFDLYSDPSNPASQPPSTADPDNDGFDNATERDAGTDPTDPNSRPDIDVDQDSDGDGIKDSADPCPSDPTNSCQPEEDPQDEDIPDPSEPSLTPVELPQFDQPTLPDISSRFDQIEANFQDGLGTLWSTLQDRFPVGMSRWIPAPPSVGGSSCDMSITLQIPDLPSAQVDICDNPVMQWAATTGRQLVLVSLMVGFLFAVARRASGA